ncbi:MAG: NTP transferase domain-containing protein [Patescibacteria group bacterium]
MTRIIILAAGKGTRMNSDLPKVLAPLNNRPMIKYLLDSVKVSGVDAHPIVVVSPDNKDIIREELKGYNVEYVIQEKQLGTGHAVASTENALSHNDSKPETLIVLFGDQPFVKAKSIKDFANLHPTALTIMPTNLPDFNEWRQNFYHLGRIVRGADGQVEKITEFKDASDEEKQISEINVGFMCFNTEWLFKNLSNLDNNNNKQEYYLTSLVNIAFAQGFAIDTYNIEPHEAMGINSLEELNIAENLIS